MELMKNGGLPSDCRSRRVFSGGSSHNHPANRAPAIRRGILFEMDSFAMKVRRRVRDLVKQFNRSDRMAQVTAR